MSVYSKLITERGKKVSDVAKNIGVTETSVRRWLKQYGEHGEDAFPGKSKFRPENEEIRRLKRVLASLEEENVILKKVRPIFTRLEK